MKGVHMSSETIGALLLGAIVGAALTYFALWRHVMRLERFGVSPSAWHVDQPATKPTTTLQVVRS
jgi:hypothetical protein